MKILTTLLFLSASSLATAEVPEEPIALKSLRYIGTGCPLGTAYPTFASDSPAISFQFDSFLAESGPGISLGGGRKNCIITVNLVKPQGWQYSLNSIDARGYINIDPGLVAEYGLTYFFEGQPATGRLGAKVSGPFASDYNFTDSIGLASQVWSPCERDRALNVNLTVRTSKESSATAPEAEGFIALDSINRIGLVWRRC